MIEFWFWSWTSKPSFTEMCIHLFAWTNVNNSPLWFSSQPQRPPNQLGTVSTPWPQSLNPWRNNAHLCVGVSLRSLPSCRELAVTDYSPLAREAVRNHKVVGGQLELQQKTQHKEPERWSSLKSTLVVFSMLWCCVCSFLKISNFSHFMEIFCPHMLSMGPDILAL